PGASPRNWNAWMGAWPRPKPPIPGPWNSMPTTCPCAWRIHHRIEAGQLDAARQDLAGMPARHRKHPHVLYAQGLLAVQDRRFAVASEYLQELRNADPGHVFGLYYLGIAHLGMG